MSVRVAATPVPPDEISVVGSPENALVLTSADSVGLPGTTDDATESPSSLGLLVAPAEGSAVPVVCGSVLVHRICTERDRQRC